MPTPRVYADFNAIEYVSDNPPVAEVALTGYGTLATLSNLKLRLGEGMALLVYEPKDIECEGIAHFDRLRRSPSGTMGEWVARIDPRKVRNSAIAEHPFDSHPCFNCGIDLLPHLAIVGRHYAEACPVCGTSVMAPLEAPDAT